MKKNWWQAWGKYVITSVGLVIFLFFRLVKLDRLPAGATVDEVNYGYIAYSLLKTGNDEHGVHWPLVFQAYGDQKLPGQAYLLIPFIEALGLNIYATRLPSALASCLLIVLIYELIKAWKFPEWSAILGAALWAIAPAPFILGRGAWESNLAMACLVIGLVGLGNLLYEQGKDETETRKKRLQATIWWTLGFAGSWYFYVPYRLITGVIWLLAAIAALTPLWGWYTRRRYLLAGVIAGVVLVAPLLLFTRSSTNLARLSQVASGNLAGIELEINEKRTFCEQQGYFSHIWCNLVYNKITLGGQTIFGDWLSTLGIDFMAVTGESEPMYHVLGYGEIPVIVYFLALIAMFPAIRAISKKTDQRGLAWLLFILITFSVIPAVLMGAQKVRLSAVFPAVYLLAAWGTVWLASLWREHFSKPAKVGMGIVIAGVSLATIFGWVSFLTTYFGYHYYKHDWETLAHVLQIDAAVDRADADRVYWHVQYPDALMFFAFDTAFKPRTFQNQAVWSDLEETGWSHTESIGDQYLVTGSSLKSVACDPEREATTEAILFVEQDGAILDEIDSYIAGQENGINPANLAIKNWRPPVAITSTNGVDTLAYVVDLDWYASIWCTPENE